MKLTTRLNILNVNNLAITLLRSTKKVIADIDIADMKIYSSTSVMAKAFNCHFTNIGQELARGILPADTLPD